ncbi:MAG TPA: hypothetical protein VF188_09380 [Longimicrobiales bacterium]
MDITYAIKQALDDGCRWLTIGAGGNFWGLLDGQGNNIGGINLDAYAGSGNNSLVLEGPGPYNAQINRRFNPDISPVFYTENTGWDIHLRGVSFVDFHDYTPASPSPLVWFQNVGGSYVKNSLFENGHAMQGPGQIGGNGDGLRLGPDQAAIITLIAPKAYNNGDNGIYIDNGLCIAGFGAMVERNDNSNRVNGAQIRLRGTPYAARGAAAFLGTHVEVEGGHPRGIVASRWRALRVAGGDFYEGGVICAADATENIVEGIALRASDVSFSDPVSDERCNVKADGCGNPLP